MLILNVLLLFSDGAVLIQPLANQAQSASARSKPHLVEVVAGIPSKHILLP